MPLLGAKYNNCLENGSVQQIVRLTTKSGIPNLAIIINFHCTLKAKKFHKDLSPTHPNPVFAS